MTKPLNVETTDMTVGAVPIPPAGRTPIADLGPLLESYRQTAVHVLASHLCVGSTCGSCGQPWPCRAACAAEQALEL